MNTQDIIESCYNGQWKQAYRQLKDVDNIDEFLNEVKCLDSEMAVKILSAMLYRAID